MPTPYYREPEAEHSLEVNEILSRPPGSLIRWGISVIGVIIALLVAATWWIRYPELVQGTAVLTTQSPPVRMLAPQSGRIEKVWVQKQDFVEKGTPLIALESAAEVEDVFALKRQLTRFATAPGEVRFDPEPNLGQLGFDYASLLQLISARDFQQNNNPLLNAQIVQIDAQVEATEQVIASLKRQQALLREESQLGEKRYQTYASLLEDSTISTQTFEQENIAYLQQLRQLETMNEQLGTYQLQLAEQQRQRAALTYSLSQQGQAASLAVREQLQRLQASVQQWEQQFVLRSPVSGKVDFFSVWAENQYVDAGTPMVSILPDTGKIIGKVRLPVRDAGLVRPGQRIQIKLDGYRYEQYGMLLGTVTHITPVPANQQYLVDFDLDNGLTTTYGVTLPFRAEYQAQASIITDDLSLWDRIFQQFRRLMTVE